MKRLCSQSVFPSEQDGDSPAAAVGAELSPQTELMGLAMGPPPHAHTAASCPERRRPWLGTPTPRAPRRVVSCHHSPPGVSPPSR